MLIYQKRERLLMHSGAAPLQFPDQGRVDFALAPGGPFGVGALSGRLALGAIHLSLEPQPNTGRYEHATAQYMDSISVITTTDDASVRVEGNVVSVRRAFESENELLALIEAVYLALPAAMITDFVDAPGVVAVTGNIGDIEFKWAYTNYPVTLDVTSKQIQERRFYESWERLQLLLLAENRRLFAALNYFYVACRLAVVGASPWEFTAEIVMNLSKVLEVLFPASPNKTIEAARAGAAEARIFIQRRGEMVYANSRIA